MALKISGTTVVMRPEGVAERVIVRSDVVRNVCV